VLTVDEDQGVVVIDDEHGRRILGLDTPEGFAAVSDAWLRAGWRVKHVYTFTWLGRPVIQLPEDLLRMQELIFRVRPDVIVETGVAHGGSLVFYASLCHLLGSGHVLGIDVEIRPHNRAAIDAHPLCSYITLVEGSSTDPAVVAEVARRIAPGERVLVVLDSNHTKAHVLEELRAYAPLVTPGSYIVAMDGYMMQLAAGGPRAAAHWAHDNPSRAAQEFAAGNADFVLEPAPFLFNESVISAAVSYSAGGTLRRIR
jgi:cephalosporin hydroxylase